ncbi:MAG: T9SS type A sorting domain-containing protein, partial [Sphingobacteriales bacterium]
KLSIQTQNFKPESITIYDDAGRLINIMSFKNEIDISALSSGVYFMEVTGIEGVVRKRVVKI